MTENQNVLKAEHRFSRPTIGKIVAALREIEEQIHGAKEFGAESTIESLKTARTGGHPNVSAVIKSPCGNYMMTVCVQL